MTTSPQDWTRRDFARLSLAALAGVSAGIEAAPAADRRDIEKNPLLSDPHVCKGLNTCRGKGANRRNRCAGTGTCATARYHTCKARNDCRGQGGCDEHPGENQCGGYGQCDVPLKPVIWQK